MRTADVRAADAEPVQVTLAAASGSVGAARRFLARVLAEWDLQALEWQALQVVSELVTNAVIHAGTPLTLVLAPHRLGLRVEVRDGSVRAPRQRHYGLQATTGRGLALVGALTADWGVETSPTGKVVWCLVPLVEDDAEPDLAAFLSPEDVEDLGGVR